MDNTEIKDLIDAYAKGRKNLVNFRHVLLTSDEEAECAPAPFHFEWSEILLHGQDNFAIEAFRESAKSQYVLRAFPLYALTFPDKSRDYIVIIKKNQTLASNKLKEIEREYLTNPAINERLKKINEQSGLVFDVDLENDAGDIVNVRIEAYGKGASIRGLANLDRRPKIVIIDDPQDTKDSESDTILESDWTWFLSDVKFLGKRSRIFLIGNNLGEKCVVERVMANADELNFKVRKIPCMSKVDGVDVSAWPAKETIEEILAEREKFRKLGKLDIWYREKMCEAIADDSRTFKKSDFQWYASTIKSKIAGECNVYIRTDLAISEKQTADYSVILVAGINSDNYWFLLDVFYERCDPTTFIEQLFTMVAKWKPKNVGLPKVAYEKALQHFVYKEMSKKNVFFEVVEQQSEQAKELRIKAMQPRFRAKTVFFPNEAEWLAETETELLMFPKALHDDIIDALASLEQNSTAPFGRKKLSELPRTTVS